MSVQGKPIDVYRHSFQDYWRCAKNSVYGTGSFLEPTIYRELQDLLNENIRSKFDRTGAALVRWSDDCPAHARELDVHAGASFDPALQPYLVLTPMGEGRLQRVLVDYYGTMQDPPAPGN